MWQVIEHDLEQLKDVCLDWCDGRGVTPDDLVDANRSDLSVFEEIGA